MRNITISKHELFTTEQYKQDQSWRQIDNVHCPSCGKLGGIWIDDSSHYYEDNIGDVHLCLSCGHSFHYSGSKINYINESETNSIVEALSTESEDG